RNLMEAVLWHGGEAEQAKQNVLSLNLPSFL
ncbi:di-heme oxidoredictase family protein, partial [Vibrio parahaemolyticus]